MDFLKIITASKDEVIKSFDRIAENLFNNYLLQINESHYRLVDIEFYFFSEDGLFKDIYTHQHEAQLNSAKWYFHKSGIDLTIGNKTDHGGILLRGLAKLKKGDFVVEKDFHGPLNVKMEICSNLYGAFEDKCNVFRLNEIHGESGGVIMKSPSYIIKTKRIGLSPKNEDTNNEYLNAEFRYQVLLDDFKLNYKNKEAIVKSLLASNIIDTLKAKEILGYNVTVL